ncbi:MAG: ribosome-inactivating family protein [Spiroplasma phoeniceum]|nr:MAG: ribosome-inactivating family protein [Spiroplasma phoeniceum]UZQ33081.1 MAG: ribosome-inactivating family protein [Spiroplasma phoeniceum]
MKKLLSLLSVLTISGSAIPTTIAASSYKKQEKLNIDINSKTNNSENLNRGKRQNNNITPEVKVSYEINDYFSDLYNAINFLQDNANIRLISPQETGGYSSPRIFYVNENSNNQYFIMPINIENDREIRLIFRSNDFYLQGFISGRTCNNEFLNVYYYFNDSTITNVSEATRSEIIPFGSNYTGSNGLRADERTPIRWTGIVDAFHQLANYGENPSFVDSNILRSSFLRVILATSEALRFREVRNNIISNYNNDTSTSNWGWYFDNFLKNWDHISKEALNYLFQLGTLVGFYQLKNINIFSKTLSNYYKSCNRRQARELNNNEYCFSNIKKDLNLIINNYFLGYLNNNDDKTIIESVKNKNKLADIEGYTIRNKTYNSAEFWIDNKNDYYEQWSWKKVYFEILVDNENPLYDKEDFFQVYYVSAGHDKIKTNLSLKTALGIEKMFYENRKTDFMIYLSNLFKKMEQKDNTAWLGSITDTDHSTLVDFIYEHYSYFHNKVLELSINKNYNTIEIETNRVGEWNPNYIYLINKK